MNLKLIVHEILEDYALPIHGDHGVSHWARVLENGLRLFKVTEANVTVVLLFAVYHDSRRINECTDADHGLRGAEFAAEQRGRLFDLSDHEFNLLYRACEGHTHTHTRTNGLILTSRFRPAGTQIDLIWDVLGSHHTQANFVLKWQGPKR